MTWEWADRSIDVAICSAVATRPWRITSSVIGSTAGGSAVDRPDACSSAAVIEACSCRIRAFTGRTLPQLSTEYSWSVEVIESRPRRPGAHQLDEGPNIAQLGSATGARRMPAPRPFRSPWPRGHGAESPGSPLRARSRRTARRARPFRRADEPREAPAHPVFDSLRNARRRKLVRDRGGERAGLAGDRRGDVDELRKDGRCEVGPVRQPLREPGRQEPA